MSDIVYLDNASTTFPKPDVVHDTMREFYRFNGVNPGRSGCELAQNAGNMVMETRRMFSEFFNPSLVQAGRTKDPDRLVFTLNATMSLNMIIAGLIGPGDHVITSLLEHNSVIRPVNHKVRKQNAESTFVAPDSRGYLDPEDIRRAIRSNTKLVIINHGSNVTGVVQDINAIGAVCREHGVPFAIDSAQTAGILPIDMHEANVSFLAFTGHKSLFGPSGTGGICVADDAEIESTIYGGTGIKSADPYQPEEYPYRLESGTLNLAGIAGMNAGLKWILDEGIETIHSREMGLLKTLQDGLSAIPGVTLIGSTGLDRRVPTVSIRIKGWNPVDFGAALDERFGVQVRPGLQCAPLIHEHHGTSPDGTVRFSIGAFNTGEHIDRALKAVSTLAGEH
ncbi:MAG TPA: aminotransferase class V-fold PLP-dependent enzyme [bacterium]|nr:aminotransferase class V-fold PLP-dependent enzyme [bacterium]